MTYLTCENLTKSYGLKPLFEGITFGLSQGDKTALVAPNGTGKSTLLKILAGNEVPDGGEVMIQNGIRTGYLEQEPELQPELTIREYISEGNSELMQIVQQYDIAVENQANEYNELTRDAFEKASAAMDAANAWDFEQRMEQILGRLNIYNLDQKISTLSGGEKKRVALAFKLLDNPDLLILDEPTNHLDVEMIEWLEAWLAKSTFTLFMVTHDRYFLNRVCNHIIEMDGGKLYHHKGNYSYYLQKKTEREAVERTGIAKAGQLLKKELEWMRRQPKARTTKSKSRIDAFYETKERASQSVDNREIELNVSMKRIGGRVLELEHVSKSYQDIVILDNFSYSFQKGEKIGIIGKNGTGKSTFLKIITGEETPDSGAVKTGATIKMSHYRQDGIQIDENLRVIDVIKEVAEVIELADGNKVTASRFLEHFLFTPEMQYTPVHKLSGGEKRRIGLMMVLIKNPNFLILDEPTNDLDLITLQKLEEFLLDFGGCLIVVSHDRFFMDKLVDHYFVFEGGGVIRDHHGTYMEYRNLKAMEEAESKKEERSSAESKKEKKTYPKKESSKLTFNERKEFQKLEKEIQNLETEQRLILEELNKGKLNPDQLQEKSERYGILTELIEEKTMDWLEMAEKE
ncbi:MAG: ABC transporter ATP-binding protein [Balneolaceae bacterium]|nr:MAG: ABC transporter ATP-binding protein [Balneolaceae bacterium]